MLFGIWNKIDPEDDGLLNQEAFHTFIVKVAAFLKVTNEGQDFENKFIHRFTSFEANVDVGNMKKYIDKDEMLVFVQHFFATELQDVNMAQLISEQQNTEEAKVVEEQAAPELTVEEMLEQNEEYQNLLK